MVSLVISCKNSLLFQRTEEGSSGARCPKICKINGVNISKNGSRDIQPTKTEMS